MMNLRSVGALLAISAVLSCATAINDGTIPGPPTAMAAGSDSGGAPGDEGGGPAAGGTVEQAGQPGSAGKAVGGSSTSSGGKGGSGSAGSGSAGSGSGGSVGVAGSPAGGSAGTSSSGGAGGSSAGSPGSGGGGTTTGPCDSPKELPATATGSPNFDTLGAICFRTKATFNSLSCSGFDGRTMKVNGVLDPCKGKMATVPPMIDGWNYLDASAGTNQYANISWWTGG